MRKKAFDTLSDGSVATGKSSVGAGTATLMHWQNRPEFQTAYRAVRRPAYGHSIIDTRRQRPFGYGAEAIFNHAAKAIELKRGST